MVQYKKGLHQVIKLLLLLLLLFIISYSMNLGTDSPYHPQCQEILEVHTLRFLLFANNYEERLLPEHRV